MKHMQIVKAADIDGARRSYLDVLARQGVALAPMTEIFVETVHRPQAKQGAWLCYISMPGQRAA